MQLLKQELMKKNINIYQANDDLTINEGIKMKTKNKVYPADKKISLYKRKILIGTDIDKNSIFVELNIQRVKTAYFKETIAHKRIRAFEVLTLSGYAHKKYSRDSEYAGQIYDKLALENIKTYMIPKNTVKRIVEIWKKYHLNDMQPNCIHQKAFNCNVKNFDLLAEIETKKCPVGYKYGSKWLVKVLPKNIKKEIISIFEEYK